jgi:hypothetical protein
MLLQSLMIRYHKNISFVNFYVYICTYIDALKTIGKLDVDIFAGIYIILLKWLHYTC